MKIIFKIPVGVCTSLRFIFKLKIALILFMAGTADISANEPFGQDDPLTVHVKNKSLIEVLDIIEKNTSYSFIYAVDDIDLYRRVSVNATEVPVQKVLDALFSKSGITYSIKDNHISLRKMGKGSTSPKKADKHNVQQDRVTISGQVTDVDGLPLAGVTVITPDRNYGVSTDIDGNYELTIPSDYEEVHFEYIGFKTFVINVTGITDASTANITMEIQVNALEEVMVTGYQTLSKERVSASFANVDKEVLETLPVTSPTQFLNGQVAGLEVKDNRVSIRGVSSFVNNSVLVVVDGFPISGGLQNVNPNNIESITVLKDAAAASIWGARSSNGVIVITTKKAAREKEESFQIEVNSFMRLADRIDLDYLNPIADASTQLDIERYLAGVNFAANPGSIDPPTVLDYDNASVMLTEGEYLESMRAIGYLTDEAVDARLAMLRGNNYQDDVNKYLLRNALTQQYNVALRGNSKKHNYNFSMLYNDTASGFVDSSSNNLTIDFNDTFRFNDWLTFNAGAFISYRKNNDSGANTGEIKALSAYDKLINPDGTYANNTSDINYGVRNYLNNFDFPYSWNYNLLQEVRNRDISSSSLQNRFQFGVDVKLMEGLSFNTKFQLERGETESRSYYGEDTYFVRKRINLASRFEAGEVSDVYFPLGDMIPNNRLGNSQSVNFRNQLNFNRTFSDKHDINFIAGVEIIENQSEGTILPEVFGASQYMNGVAQLPDMSETLDYGVFNNTTFLGILRNPRFIESKIRYFSAYGNLAYSFDNRYTVTGSIRTDASNIVSDDPKYRYQPLWSVGFNWNAANEGFMQNVNIFDRLNFRVSYGLNANAAVQTSNVTTINYFTGNLGNENSIYTSFNHGNPNLKWEITRTFNAGIDWAVFKSNLFGSIDLYNKQGEDLYYARSYPTTSGVDRLNVNYAGINNKGVEVTLGGNIDITPAISINSRANYTYNDNEITDLVNDNITLFNQRGSFTYFKGDAYRDLYVFRYDGYENDVPYVISQDGDRHPMNTPVPNTTNEDFPLLYNVGRTIAPHLMGWTNTIRIHDFSITSIITGKFGHVVQNGAIPYGRPSITGNRNFNENLVNYLDNESAPDFPGLINENTVANLQQQSRYTPFLESYVDSADFIRFNDLIINYNASRLLSKVNFLDNVNVYCNISNLGMIWTANKWNMDPEAPLGTLKPVTTYTFGLRMNIK